MNYVTYRMGADENKPLNRDGSEVDDMTSLSMADYIAETETVTGPITVIWMGCAPMPNRYQWLAVCPDAVMQ